MTFKGQRQSKQASPKDKFKELEVQLQNNQMAIQMSQMMIKHLADQLSALQNDVGSNMGMLNDFQYRTLAMLEVGGFNKDAVDTKAEEFKLVDFSKISDKEDLQKGFSLDDDGIVNEESIVILSTTTPDLTTDEGIFRSKFPMSECLTPDIRSKLLGLKIGDTFESLIYGVKHIVTLVGLRKVQQVLAQENTDQAGE